MDAVIDGWRRELPELARQGSDTLRAVLLAIGDWEPEAQASRTTAG